MFRNIEDVKRKATFRFIEQFNERIQDPLTTLVHQLKGEQDPMYVFAMFEANVDTIQDEILLRFREREWQIFLDDQCLQTIRKYAFVNMIGDIVQNAPEGIHLSLGFLSEVDRLRRKYIDVNVHEIFENKMKEARGI